MTDTNEAAARLREWASRPAPTLGTGVGNWNTNATGMAAPVWKGSPWEMPITDDVRAVLDERDKLLALAGAVASHIVVADAMRDAAWGDGHEAEDYGPSSDAYEETWDAMYDAFADLNPANAALSESM